MSVQGWTPAKEVLNPRGMWSYIAEKRKGSVSRASFMQNQRISPGVTRSRPGTTAIAPVTDGKVTAIFNWITPDDSSNLVLYQDALEVKSFRQDDQSISLLFPVPSNTRAVSFADLDIWVYVAGYDVKANGTTQCHIFDGTNSDIAFRGPITVTSVSFAVAAGGQCTIGTHYIGFVYQNRTGFATVPTTTFGGNPISVTLAADLQKITVTVTLPALLDGGGNATLFLIMTRADNPANWYYMPSDLQFGTGMVGEMPVPYNTAVTLNFVASISDEDMAASLDSANDQFGLLTQDSSFNGPFNPSFVVAYGQRMCYGNGTILYVSDINNPQQIAADRNAVTLPNQRKIAYAFPLPGSQSLFLMGDRWTSYVNDNSDIPATWAQPVGISGTLGAPTPNCICFRTGGNYAWIVTEGGVYRFTGVYDDLPVTYLVSDQWARVNWLSAYAVQIADNVPEHRVYVGVALDGAAEPNAMFCIDYTNGLQYDQVDISLDVLNPRVFTAFNVVKEISTDQTNLWIAPPSALGTYNFTVRVTDIFGAQDEATCSINLQPQSDSGAVVMTVDQYFTYQFTSPTKTNESSTSCGWGAHEFLPHPGALWNGDTASTPGIVTGENARLIGAYTTDYWDLGIPQTPANDALFNNASDLETAKELYKQVTFHFFIAGQMTDSDPFMPPIPTSTLDVYLVYLVLNLSNGQTVKLYPSTVSVFDNGAGIGGGGVVNTQNAIDRSSTTASRITRLTYGEGPPFDNAHKYGWTLKVTDFIE